MTKTTDKQLENWLNHYQVDTSDHRLKRLEERILEKLPARLPAVFAPMNWMDRTITAVGVCSVALGVFVLSQLGVEQTSYSLASVYSYQLLGH